ncbi:MAG TPA: T9SS type B sorting domain-containing protein, partial [Flavobacteriales bacterium]|nr:T9SS type B sorting domain-containing protein [Flavobacteriales bacterium]
LFVEAAWQTLAGTYFDTVPNAMGCDSTITTTLSLDSFLDASISSVSALCANNGPITLSAVSPVGTWSGTGITDVDSGIFDPAIAGAGSYQIVYVTGGNCGDSDTIIISVYEVPALSFVTTPESCNDENDGAVDLTVSGGAIPYTYLWNDQGASTIEDLTSLSPGSYAVIVNDSNSCSVTGTIYVIESTQLCFTPYVYIPNIFSPNADGENDKLFVQGKGIVEIVFIIYDRWGEKIFETNDLSTGWDGAFKGKPMNEAVFVYYVKATLINESIVEKTGNLTLVR